MQLPIVTPAPLVAQHAEVFRLLFENRCQFRHFQNYLTALMVLENKSLANISRCILDSADKTNLSRFFSTAPWFQEAVNERRIAYMLEQTAGLRYPLSESCLVLDDTLCEHVGSLFEYVDRHYDHSEDRYPLAHCLVTSYYISGAVRFPVDLRLYRRYEEITAWETFVRKHFPECVLPTRKKERQKLHKEVDPVLLQDPQFHVLHESFKSKIVWGRELVEKAVQRELPFQVVLMDSWYLAPDLVTDLKNHHKNWVSLLKKNRNLEVASFTLRDAQGQGVALPGPHIQVQALVPLIPPSAYQKVTVEEKEYGCFTLSLRVPGLGKVRLVISFENAELTGPYAVLVSNRTDWSARKILATYLHRWPIETFYQDGKGHLGLDEYRMRTAEALQKHWGLVFVAYSLLHLDCLPPSLVQGKGLPPSRPVKTIGAACRQQGQALIEGLILWAHDCLQQGQPAEQVFAALFAKQQQALGH